MPIKSLSPLATFHQDFTSDDDKPTYALDIDLMPRDQFFPRTVHIKIFALSPNGTVVNVRAIHATAEEARTLGRTLLEFADKLDNENDK